MRIQSKILILFLVLSLGSCGFHLRGQTYLSGNLQQLSIVWSEDQELNDILKANLQKSGATLSDEGAILTVSFNIQRELILAQSASGLRVELLAVELSYTVTDHQTKEPIQSKTIVQKKEFEFDTDQVLASRSEKLKVYKKLKQNAVRVLMFQLQRLG